MTRLHPAANRSPAVQRFGGSTLPSEYARQRHPVRHRLLACATKRLCATTTPVVLLMSFATLGHFGCHAPERPVEPTREAFSTEDFDGLWEHSLDVLRRAGFE